MKNLFDISKEEEEKLEKLGEELQDKIAMLCDDYIKTLPSEYVLMALANILVPTAVFCAPSHEEGAKFVKALVESICKRKDKFVRTNDAE
jgi:hypothetical protein